MLQDPRPRLLLLCGVAFSGKTTLGRRLAERLDAAWVSTDDINAEREVGHGGDGLPAEVWEETHRLALERIGGHLAAGRHVVVDDTSCFRWIRDRFRSAGERHGVGGEVIFLDVSDDEIDRRRRRNDVTGERRGLRDEVFEAHRSTFEPPGDDEVVVRYRPDDDLEFWLDRLLAGPSPRDPGRLIG